jgi:hypothetical protein
MTNVSEMTFCDERTFKVGDRVMLAIRGATEYPYAVPGTITEIVVPKRGPIMIKALPDNVTGLSYPDAWPLKPEYHAHYGKTDFCEWRDHGKTAGNIRDLI